LRASFQISSEAYSINSNSTAGEWTAMSPLSHQRLEASDFHLPRWRPTRRVANAMCIG
jgi:hypothetical protein